MPSNPVEDFAMTKQVRTQTGQSTVEYTVVLVAMTAALFMPWNNEPSAAVQFMDAVRTMYSDISYTLSLP